MELTERQKKWQSKLKTPMRSNKIPSDIKGSLFHRGYLKKLKEGRKVWYVATLLFLYFSAGAQGLGVSFLGHRLISGEGVEEGTAVSYGAEISLYVPNKSHDWFLRFKTGEIIGNIGVDKFATSYLLFGVGGKHPVYKDDYLVWTLNFGSQRRRPIVGVTLALDAGGIGLLRIIPTVDFGLTSFLNYRSAHALLGAGVTLNYQL